MKMEGYVALAGITAQQKSPSGAQHIFERFCTFSAEIMKPLAIVKVQIRDHESRSSSFIPVQQREFARHCFRIGHDFVFNLLAAAEDLGFLSVILHMNL